MMMSDIVNIMAVLNSLKMFTSTYEVSWLKFWNSFEARFSKGKMHRLHRLFNSIYFEIEAPKTEKMAFRVSTAPKRLPISVLSLITAKLSSTTLGHSRG